MYEKGEGAGSRPKTYQTAMRPNPKKTIPMAAKRNTTTKSRFLKFFLQGSASICAMIYVCIQLGIQSSKFKSESKGPFSQDVISSKEEFLAGFQRRRNLLDHSTTENQTTIGKREVTIDIISIGSKMRPEYMETQKATWASSLNVRNFLQIDEDDDDDPSCYKTLTHEQAISAVRWCQRRYNKNLKTGNWLTNRWVQLLAHKKWLSKKGDNAAGWLCAQKRFAFGLSRMMRQYQDETSSPSAPHQKDQVDSSPFPDYLILVDDDTFMDLDRLVDLELKSRNPDEAYVAGGCRVSTIGDVQMAYGGFGTIFSKGTLQRFSRPIYCTNSNGTDGDDIYVKSVCEKISKNLIFEKEYFHDGMSLFELMDARTRAEPFTQWKNWTSGFCFHGDHYFAILIEQYGLSKSKRMEVIHDSVAIYNKQGLKTMKGNCLYDKLGECDLREATICHHQNPSNMEKLHKQVLLQQNHSVSSIKPIRYP